MIVGSRSEPEPRLIFFFFFFNGIVELVFRRDFPTVCAQVEFFFLSSEAKIYIVRF